MFKNPQTLQPLPNQEERQANIEQLLERINQQTSTIYNKTEKNNQKIDVFSSAFNKIKEDNNLLTRQEMKLNNNKKMLEDELQNLKNDRVEFKKQEELLRNEKQQLVSKIEELNSEKKEIENNIIERDQTIKELRQAISDGISQQDVDVLNNQLSQLKNEQIKMEKELTDRIGESKNIQTLFEENQKQFEELKKENEVLKGQLTETKQMSQNVDYYINLIKDTQEKNHNRLVYLVEKMNSLSSLIDEQTMKLDNTLSQSGGSTLKKKILKINKMSKKKLITIFNKWKNSDIKYFKFDKHISKNDLKQIILGAVICKYSKDQTFKKIKPILSKTLKYVISGSKININDI